jgi:hypothetical protein
VRLFKDRSIHVSAAVDPGGLGGLIQKFMRGEWQIKGENLFLNFELRRFFLAHGQGKSADCRQNKANDALKL